MRSRLPALFFWTFPLVLGWEVARWVTGQAVAGDRGEALVWAWFGALTLFAWWGRVGGRRVALTISWVAAFATLGEMAARGFWPGISASMSKGMTLPSGYAPVSTLVWWGVISSGYLMIEAWRPDAKRGHTILLAGVALFGVMSFTTFWANRAGVGLPADHMAGAFVLALMLGLGLLFNDVRPDANPVKGAAPGVLFAGGLTGLAATTGQIVDANWPMGVVALIWSAGFWVPLIKVARSRKTA